MNFFSYVIIIRNFTRTLVNCVDIIGSEYLSFIQIKIWTNKITSLPGGGNKMQKICFGRLQTKRRPGQSVTERLSSRAELYSRASIWENFYI